MFLSGFLRKEPRGGETFYPLRAGGGSLGLYSAAVGIGFDDVGETVMNDLDPGVQRSFKLLVPVSFQLITSETYFFTFTSPVEEE